MIEECNLTGGGSRTSTEFAVQAAAPVRLCMRDGGSVPQPLTVGVPWPRAVLWRESDVQLVAPSGELLPLQAEVLARWSDGSVKWLLADTMMSGKIVHSGTLNLQVRGETATVRPLSNGRASLIVTEQTDSFHIDTGVTEFRVDRRRLTPVERLGRSGAAQVMETVFRDARGKQRKGVVESSRIETQGPIRATLLLEGTFCRARGLRFRCRLCFFGGTGLVRVRFTLHNPNRAHHRGGLWDLGDPASILFRELSFVLRSSNGPAQTSWIAEPGQGPHLAEDGHVTIYQDSSGGENWHSCNHVNRDGRVPCRFRGYEVRTTSGVIRGLRANPVLAWGDGTSAVAAAVPEFWQQFPKLMSAEARHLRLGLFPDEWDDLHELQGGEQKTHTLWLCCGEAFEATLDSLKWVNQPARAVPAPEWTEATGALPHFVAAAYDTDPRLQALLDEALNGDQNLFVRREAIDEFGWRHHGDIYADHENAYYGGPKPVISHYNNQYDFLYGAVIQWLRTGDSGWFDLADPLARHVIDIDIYHTTYDRAAYCGGLFWHTDHYLDAATATHRTYSRTNCPADGRPYGGGPGNEHAYATGLLHYYYLTGDRQSLHTVLELAECVVNQDDGRQNLLGVVDDGPTGLATVGDDFGNSVPGRGPANSVNVLLDAWLASADGRYLEIAELFIRRVIHPQDVLDSQRLLHIEDGWSYTMFLLALSRYLDLKHEAGQIDEMYAYAKASLLHYVHWMQYNERPYFDRLREMQFPTETWAAQELRKANVLRLASLHAAEETRAALCRRGNEFADRAWADLSRFSTRCSARAVAILLTEGVRDQLFRTNPPLALSARTEFAAHGEPQRFVPQKARVAARLRSVSGIARTLGRAALPSTYHRIIRHLYRRHP